MLQTSLRSLDAIRRNGSRPGTRAASRIRTDDAPRVPRQLPRIPQQRHYGGVLHAEVSRLLADQLGRRGQRIAQGRR